MMILLLEGVELGVVSSKRVGDKVRWMNRNHWPQSDPNPN
jgi:hypothetical protein